MKTSEFERLVSNWDVRTKQSSCLMDSWVNLIERLDSEGIVIKAGMLSNNDPIAVLFVEDTYRTVSYCSSGDYLELGYLKHGELLQGFLDNVIQVQPHQWQYVELKNPYQVDTVPRGTYKYEKMVIVNQVVTHNTLEGLLNDVDIKVHKSPQSKIYIDLYSKSYNGRLERVGEILVPEESLRESLKRIPDDANEPFLKNFIIKHQNELKVTMF